MHPFEEYLKQHNLEALTVSIKARVRYVTIYNATKGIPITPEHAKKIHEAVYALTGTPYQGTFTLLSLEPGNIPTIPIRKIPRN